MHLLIRQRPIKAIAVLAGSLLLAMVACTGDGSRDLFGTPSISPLTALQPSSVVPGESTPTVSPLPTLTRPATLPTSRPPIATPTVSGPPIRVVPTRPQRTPTPLPTPFITPVPALETLEIYARGEFQNGYNTLSIDAPSPDPTFVGRQYLGNQTLFKNLKMPNGNGEFMSVFTTNEIDLIPFTHVRIVIASITATGSWVGVNLAIQPWEWGGSSFQLFVPPTGWHTFTVPIDELDTFGTTDRARGIGFRGESGPGARNTDNAIAFGEISLVRIPDVLAPRVVSVSDGSAAVLNVEFSESTTGTDTSSFILSSASDPVYVSGRAPRIIDTYESGRFAQVTFDPPMLTGVDYTLSVTNVSDAAGNGMTDSTHNLRPVLNRVTLSVDATQDINPFTSKMRGMTMQTASVVSPKSY